MDTSLIASLEELLDFAGPDSLRRSLQQVFFHFLLHNNHCLPANFNTITEDVYFRIRFLDEVLSSVFLLYLLRVSQKMVPL
ncbi:MAG: hypothetical protein V4506_09995 [Bacteroidota bacterium]